jgi:hypothetical protein
MKRFPILLWAIVMAALVLVPRVASADPCRSCNDSCDFTIFLGSPVCGVGLGSCAFCATWNEYGLEGNTWYCQLIPCVPGPEPWFPKAKLRDEKEAGATCRLAGIASKTYRAVRVEVTSART